MTGRALITGASGFLGRHLTKALRRKAIATVALVRESSGPTDADESVAIADPTNSDHLEEIITQARPDWIFHLAGRTTASSLADLYRVNVLYGAALLRACGRLRIPPVVVMAGSAAEYGPSAGAVGPVDENVRCDPTSAYGITKLAQTHHALAEPYSVVVARLFNPVGAGMGEHLALGSFARQIAALGPEGGKLVTGPLDVERDFIEVSAAAEAMITLAQSRPTKQMVVNICSGSGTRLRDLLDGLVAASGMPIQIDERRDGGSATSAALQRFVGSSIRLASCGITIPPASPDCLGRDILTAFNPRFV